MDEKERKQAEASLLKDMETTAARMRELIMAMLRMICLAIFTLRP
jgi:hypothetical protein